MEKTSTPLLTTKLNRPSPRPNLVPRPRRQARLDEALHMGCRLTLISAKAGSGKTTLVSAWLRQQDRPAVWLSLDENDSDPWRFLRYLTAALQQLGIEAGSVLPDQVDTPYLPQAEHLAVELVNALAASPHPALLVLDDYHLIQNAWIHQAVGFLVEHLPPGMQLLILTRIDPPLPLSRLRGRGLLSEIRDSDLRFTPGEAALFLREGMGLDLPDTVVFRLGARTEGWIVGLQMAAISLRGHTQEGALNAFVEAFGGTNRFILDYLLEEVLDQQPPEVQEFLITTSILERMCAHLCDALRIDEPEGSGSQVLLTRLERANLFVIPLDDERRWYRYHHLFADLLKSTLRQRMSAEQVRGLHRRASRWHQEQGTLEEAMVHAMAAGDFERAAVMIEENIVSMLSRSEVPVLLRWIKKLPRPLVRSHPWIDVYHANTLALAGRLDEVDALLEDVEKRILPGEPQSAELLGHIAAVRAYAANLRGDAARTIEMAALTKQYLPEGYLTAQGMAAYALADTCIAGDDMQGADRALLDVLDVGEKTDQLMLVVQALSELALVRQVQGKLHQAEALYERAWQWMKAKDGLGARVRCAYEFGLADLLRERNQLDGACKHLSIALAYRRRLGGYWVVGDVVVMRVLQARGDSEGALDALRSAEQIIQTHHFQIAALIRFHTARVVQWLAVGDVDMAANAAEACVGGSEQEQIALARLKAAQGNFADALGLLEQQRVLAEAGGRIGRLIEILGLQAVALEMLEQPGQAEAVVMQALSLAWPEGYVRVFLDLGMPLYRLLKRLAAREMTQSPALLGYVRDLLDAFRMESVVQQGRAAGQFSHQSHTAEAFVDPLTERELEVLHLLAEGISNKEIAGRLFVEPSTVKQHLKNIYGKLNVHSRTQAVRRGRELDLL